MNIEKHMVRQRYIAYRFLHVCYHLVRLVVKRGKLYKVISNKNYDTTAYIRRLTGMVRAYLFNRLEYELFEGFGLSSIPHCRWHEFVGVCEGREFALHFNTEFALFNDKLKTFERFSKYYKRRVLRVSNTASFRQMYEGGGAFFMKPIDGLRGIGTCVIRDRNVPCEEFIATNKNAVAEDLVVQSADLSALNLSSVNTVRMATFLFDEGVEISFSVLRVGRAGRCCDNGGAGGILCSVDINTGRVVAAADESGAVYSCHPDSGRKLIGFQLPQFAELVSIVKEVARLTVNRYGAWDFAHTDKGWVMIEGNATGEFISQFPTRKGVRTIIENALLRMGL